MTENATLNLTLSHETAALLLDLVSRAETPLDEAKKHVLCEMFRAALYTPQQPPLEAAREEARINLAQATENLAEAKSAFADELAHGGEHGQSMASATVSTEETRVQGARAAYDVATRKALQAEAESAERKRQAAYTKSEKAHDEALAALKRYEPMAQEMLKLFQILSFHTDLALADVEAADEARISPHAANVADHLKKALQEQKTGHSEAVTKRVLAALRELDLARAELIRPIESGGGPWGETEARGA